MNLASSSDYNGTPACSEPTRSELAPIRNSSPSFKCLYLYVVSRIRVVGLRGKR